MNNAHHISTCYLIETLKSPPRRMACDVLTTSLNRVWNIPRRAFRHLYKSLHWWNISWSLGWWSVIRFSINPDNRFNLFSWSYNLEPELHKAWRALWGWKEERSNSVSCNWVAQVPCKVLWLIKILFFAGVFEIGGSIGVVSVSWHVNRTTHRIPMSFAICHSSQKIVS